MKYPKESLPHKPTKHIADKKYGFFQSEKEAFLDVANELGLSKRGSKGNVAFSRHPLTFLVEAADDICYTIIDFEDGINLGLIQEDLALEYLINLVKGTINTKKYQLLSNTQDRLSYLRALAINTLINEVVDLFVEHEADILEGTFSKSLMEVSRYQAQIKDIIKVSVENIYQSKEVIEKEIAGYEVINQLLDNFTNTIYNVYKGKLSSYDQLILKILPETFNIEEHTLYENLLTTCHYVSLLSDGNAMLTYKKIKGGLF